MAGTPDPKPARRIVDRDVLPPGWRWSDGSFGVRFPVRDGDPAIRCLACGQAAGQTNVSRFHLVPKGLGGDDVPENLCWACGDGVRGCHGTWECRLDRPAPGCPLFPFRIGEVTVPTWQLVGHAIRVKLTGDQLLYVLTKKGPWYLDESFPLLEVSR